MRRDNLSQQSKSETCNHMSGGRVWTIIGGVAIALAMYALVSNFKDIQRYSRMVRM